MPQTENINLKALITAILQVARKPITFKSDSQYNLMGNQVSINGGEARGYGVYFQFSDVKSFLKGMVKNGLYLNDAEQRQVLRLYNYSLKNGFKQ